METSLGKAPKKKYKMLIIDFLWKTKSWNAIEKIEGKIKEKLSLKGGETKQMFKKKNQL